LEKLKGLHTLIPVFRRYRKAYLLVAGEGRYGSYVRKLAKDCPNIVFLNWLPYDQLEGLYRGAVALIIPSLYYDISPLVIIEAFKHKIPVIARNLGGMPEIVAESRGGFLYDTEEDLIAAMDQLLSNPSHRDNLGQRGFETYKQKWTVEAHLQGYFSIIEHIAKQRGLPLIPSS
jgi:glycosyltransferase involved in cell wall biosynthesis